MVPNVGLEPTHLAALPPQSSASTIPPTRHIMAGEEGFEPSHAGIKILCLTAWLLPYSGALTWSRTKH